MAETAQPLGWVNFWKPKDDWYYLPDGDRRDYLRRRAEVVATAEAQGAHQLGAYRSRGQSSWPRFELWEFPDLDTLIQMVEGLEEIGHYRYFAEDNTVGRRYARSETPDGWVV